MLVVRRGRRASAAYTTATTRVLIIEDEPSMVSVLRDNFEYEGYEVITAEDGAAGLERVFADNPDLVILDVMMPRMSGLDVCRQMKTTCPSVPIIMLTAPAAEVGTDAGGSAILRHGARNWLQVCQLICRDARSTDE